MDPLFTRAPAAPWTGASVETEGHSQAAARRIEIVAGSLRWRVLEAIAGHEDGLTDGEIEQYCNLGGSTARPRRIECLAGGLIMFAGRSRQTPAGRWSAVWVVTPAGRAVVNGHSAGRGQ
jgi:hypothetical protein